MLAIVVSAIMEQVALAGTTLPMPHGMVPLIPLMRLEGLRPICMWLIEKNIRVSINGNEVDGCINTLVNDHAIKWNKSKDKLSQVYKHATVAAHQTNYDQR